MTTLPQPNPRLGTSTWQLRCSLSFVLNNHHALPTTTTAETEFYRETKWCDACQARVRFLMSVNHSYCVDCGGRVRMFSREESARFAETVQRHKYQAC